MDKQSAWVENPPVREPWHQLAKVDLSGEGVILNPVPWPPVRRRLGILLTGVRLVEMGDGR